MRLLGRFIREAGCLSGAQNPRIYDFAFWDGETRGSKMPGKAPGFAQDAIWPAAVPSGPLKAHTGEPARNRGEAKDAAGR